ncbi:MULTISPECIES: carboxymuconolactone decarboxylase family protein [Burkholderia cepacia complex]|uniref:carboxymuconolactone decarboxylase family protein n=1 Tax=Burkholderia cepacia complex TaxID=87882 RepID=UPI001CF17537|nr:MULTISPECIES: carboxymuconolactone decarboxylase family protein [Burkholderia cepacia complex]MCA8057407.1 carboxymuconolactone decarboxylase family protein [Burkholderia cepacia]MDN7535263.1 carboxymuconolactone decarboxylase family protein [Burkholderia orbicola]
MDTKDVVGQTTVPALYKETVENLQCSTADIERIASDSLTARMVALIKLAIALAIPNREMAVDALRQAKAVASEDDIAEMLFVVCALKSGPATAYGRLIFKFLDPSSEANDEIDERTQIQRDRALMTPFMSASPEAFAAFQRRASALKRKALSDKEYELISIACASITHCVYCLEGHGSNARKAGVTDREVADTLHLAISARTTATLQEWKGISASVLT